MPMTPMTLVLSPYTSCLTSEKDPNLGRAVREGGYQILPSKKAADKIAHVLVTTPLKTRVGMDQIGWDLADGWVGVSE